MHFHARKSAYILENLLFVCGSYSLVFEPMVLDHSILSYVLIPSIGPMVLVCYGFGSWYWEKPNLYKNNIIRPKGVGVNWWISNEVWDPDVGYGLVMPCLIWTKASLMWRMMNDGTGYQGLEWLSSYGLIMDRLDLLTHVYCDDLGMFWCLM